MKDRKAVRILLPLLFWLLVWQAASTALAFLQRRRHRSGAAAVHGAAPGTGAAARRPAAGGEQLCPAGGNGSVLEKRRGQSGTDFCRTDRRRDAGDPSGRPSLPASRTADLLLSPAIRVVRATPVASFIVLVLLWVRTGLVPGVISGLMVLPVVWENVRRGIGETDGHCWSSGGPMASAGERPCGSSICPPFSPISPAG